MLVLMWGLMGFAIAQATIIHGIVMNITLHTRGNESVKDVHSL